MTAFLLCDVHPPILSAHYHSLPSFRTHPLTYVQSPWQRVVSLWHWWPSMLRAAAAVVDLQYQCTQNAAKGLNVCGSNPLSLSEIIPFFLLLFHFIPSPCTKRLNQKPGCFILWWYVKISLSFDLKDPAAIRVTIGKCNLKFIRQNERGYLRQLFNVCPWRPIFSMNFKIHYTPIMITLGY